MEFTLAAIQYRPYPLSVVKQVKELQIVDQDAVEQEIVQALRNSLKEQYEFRSLLGRGGMAVVFEAVDLKHDRSVAVKILKRELAAAVGRDRFLQEIRFAAQLSHPHILPLLDSGDAGGLLYFVMPIVQGGSLADRISAHGALPIREALELARAVAHALDYAHRQGIVHRDVKPDNIMIHDGVAVVTDFGVGKGLHVTEGGLTSAGFVLGTPAYMSPEQVAGDSVCDGRSDVYSLGCMLYEMLTGVTPFTAATAQASMAMRILEPPPRLPTDKRLFPAAIDRVLQRALATAPDDRYETAAQFAQALTTALAIGGGPFELAARTQKSVAVLPFVNMSSDPENEFLSDGISEDITHVLGKVEGLRVVARTSAFAFKGKTEDVRRIGDALGVSHIVEGSVRKAGNRLRITSQLIDVEDGSEQWSSTYDRSVDDVFKIQDEITSAVVKQLKLKLLGNTTNTQASSTDAFDTYETYLKGRHFWNKRNETGLHKSLELLNTAVEADRQFALAWSGLAATHLALGQYGLARPDEAMPAAKAAAHRAIEIDPTVAEALAALASVKSIYEWDHTGAETDFRNAIDLNPQYSTALHWYAINHLTPTEKFDEALACLRRAQTSDPLSSVINTTVGLVHFYQKDFAKAAVQLRDVINLDETFAIAHYFLGQVLRHNGSYTDAITVGKRARELASNSAETVSALAQTYALSGNPKESRVLLNELMERAKLEYVSPGLIAPIHIALQEIDTAFQWLDTAVEMRTPELIWLRVHPVFDSIRTDERFGRVLATIFP